MAVEGMATGHSTIFTAHADKPIDTINRLVINYQKAMPMLGSDIVERIVGNAVDFVVIKKNIPGIGRKITGISEINFDFDKGRVKIVPIMKYSYATDEFRFVNSISEDCKEKMLGAGVKYDDLVAWEKKAGVYKEDAERSYY